MRDGCVEIGFDMCFLCRYYSACKCSVVCLSASGSVWNYATGVPSLTQRWIRDGYAGSGGDGTYWSSLRNRLAKRIGARSMLMEVDPSGARIKIARRKLEFSYKVI
jgi:hypothetical protein